MILVKVKESHELRWGGMAGIAAIVIAIIGRLVMGNAPKVMESSTTIAGFLLQYRTQVLLGSLLLGIATMLFLWFGIAMATAFRRADEVSDTPAMVLAGYVLLAALGFVGVSLLAGMTYSLTAHRSLMALAGGPYTAVTVMGAISGIAVAATFGATAAAIMRTHVFPMWMAWCAIAVAVVQLLAAFAVGSVGGVFGPDSLLVGVLPGVLTALWVLAASWMLIREHLPIPAAGARPVMGH
ncbi:hypothetical protein ABZ297_31880 [Nonomuraea sp. NPDC005983]|uniref:hypothetical protein n=1 Tax=Nonomuraea sp. NPDC005983 TaxID=3155595 RepID=UPI0033B7D9DB